MPTTQNKMTQEGLDRLRKELEERRGERREAINRRMAAARDFGDFSENSELDDASEEHARNESRINELEQIIATAEIVTAGDATTVSLGTTVEVEDERGQHMVFHMVGSSESNSIEHKISSDSPVGSALSGHEVGDCVSYTIPSGKVRKLTITSIRISE